MDDLDWVAIERRAKRAQAAEMGRLMESAAQWIARAWCRALEARRAPDAPSGCGAR